jgi:hypothetical protein
MGGTMIIGLSVSDSPDLQRLGLSDLHLRDAMVELARYLLAASHGLAYGGDLRPSGFTLTLRDLVATYGAGKGRVKSFLAWYVHAGAAAAMLADLATVSELHRCPLPSSLDSAKASAESPAVRALCLSDMRRRMNDAIDARLLLGGKTAGYQGLLPGLLEEAALAASAHKPVFLIGAFGGCTRAIIDTVLGQTAFAPAPVDEKLRAEYRAQGGNPDGVFADALATLQGLGLDGLARDNHLTVDENRTLFDCNDLDYVIALVLKGLASKR